MKILFLVWNGVVKQPTWKVLYVGLEWLDKEFLSCFGGEDAMVETVFLGQKEDEKGKASGRRSSWDYSDASQSALDT